MTQSHVPTTELDCCDHVFKSVYFKSAWDFEDLDVLHTYRGSLWLSSIDEAVLSLFRQYNSRGCPPVACRSPRDLGRGRPDKILRFISIAACGLVVRRGSLFLPHIDDLFLERRLLRSNGGRGQSPAHVAGVPCRSRCLLQCFRACDEKTSKPIMHSI